MKFKVDGLASDEIIEDLGDFERDPCAHYNDVDACQYRPIKGRQKWRLDFMQEIDTHHAGMAFFGEEYVNEVGGDQ